MDLTSSPMALPFTAAKSHYSNKKTNMGTLVIGWDKNFLGAVEFIPAKGWTDHGMNLLIH